MQIMMIWTDVGGKQMFANVIYSVTASSSNGGAAGAAILLLCLVGFLLALFLYARNEKEKKRDEEYEIKDDHTGYGGGTYGGMRTSTPDKKPAVEKEKTKAEKGTGSTIKYGRGFDNKGFKKKDQPPKEAEQFYRYDHCYERRMKNRIICPHCGVENEQGSSQCMLCGQILG
ncbi:MAG: hypothetical protein EOM40_03320 [Clostridia bacterium]|nr:hypothetical protein [Clostridia bacterium]NCC43257.1 hypothetical protein [Clostridia bacterium]